MAFAHSDWLWLLLVIPILLLGRIWADLRSDGVISALTANRLRDVLVKGGSSWRSAWIFGLQLAALGLFILALCRPQWGEEKRELKESGRNILIAIDTSRSMLATDVTPDRLTRAKLAAQDLLMSLAGDRVGLIAFAGQAYLQAPLTTDHEPILESIQTLDTTSVPQGGSDVTKALRIAIEAVEKSPARSHGLILFSDGGDQSANLASFTKQAAEKRILVLTVGVGTDAGSLIPNPDPSMPGDFVRDSSGNVVQTKLDSRVLQEIASATGGRYLKLSSQSISSSLVTELLSALDRQQGGSKEQIKPIERFRWPLTLGIVLLMFAWFIRPLRPKVRLSPAAASSLVILFSTSGVEAHDGIAGSLLGSLFQRAESEASAEAKAAYEGGQFEKAKEVYSELLKKKVSEKERHELSYGLAAAAHKLKDFDRAVDAFSEALKTDDPEIQNRVHRGIAHSLYDQGDRALAKQPQFTIRAWTDSLRHFDASLALAENQEAQENRDFVQKRLDELKKAEEEKKQQQQQKKKGGKKEGKEGQGKEGDESEDGEEGNEGKQGDKKGKQKDKEGKEGDNGEEKEGDKGDKGEQEGEEGQGKEALPDGQIAAGQGGEKPEESDPQEQREMAESERNETTGFSRNEARAFLRTYADDQKAAVLRQQRRQPANGKDW
jgi:Ca-activated chloride channel homolog